MSDWLETIQAIGLTARRGGRFALRLLCILCAGLLLFINSKPASASSRFSPGSRDGRFHSVARSPKPSRHLDASEGRRWSASKAPSCATSVCAESTEEDDAAAQHAVASPPLAIIALSANPGVVAASQTLRPLSRFDFPLHSPAP